MNECRMECFRGREFAAVIEVDASGRFWQNGQKAEHLRIWSGVKGEIYGEKENFHSDCTGEQKEEKQLEVEKSAEKRKGNEVKDKERETSEQKQEKEKALSV